MVEYKVINTRLVWVRFKLGITRVFLLAVYAAVSSGPVSELEEFWESDRDVLNTVRDNEKLIVTYYMNGWVGTARSGYESVLGKYGDKKVNEAGKLILEFCKEIN